MSHISISFPDHQCIEILQQKFTGLNTLEVLVYPASDGDVGGTGGSVLLVSRGLEGSAKAIRAPGDMQSVPDTLGHLGERLRGIPSLTEIIVRVYGGRLAPELMYILRELGWVVLPAGG